ncbi:MAG: DEAD/DEAH box helicase [Methanobacteriota archaeon]
MKVVTLSPRGRYILVTFPEDEALTRAFKAQGRLHWKPNLGGWVTEVKDVAGVVTVLRAMGLSVRYGPPVSPERRSPSESYRPSVFDRPVPREVAEGRESGFSTQFLQDTYLPPEAPVFPRSYVASWRSPTETLPTLEPVDLERLDTDFVVPGFKGELYPFQRQGVAFLKHLGWSGILADEMGLGKTIMAMAASILAGERTLVVSPASVKYNWLAEIKRFTDKTWRVAEGGRLYGPEDAHFTVINYDILPRQLERLNAEGFGMVVLDEAHYCKNLRAKRSQAALHLTPQRRILLTGTPLLNRPQEIWPLVNYVQPGKWGSFNDFFYLYCRRVTRLSPDGLEVSGVSAEHLRDLKHRLRGAMIRRQKSVVLTDLPAKTIEVQPVRMPREAKDTYDALESDITDYLETEGLDAAFRGGAWLKTLAKMHQLKQFTIAQRLPFARAWLEQKAADGEKVVTFSQYLDPLHELHRAFDGASILIDGSVPSDERLLRVDRFQARSDLSYCIGQIQACGVGLNLTAARHVLFLDLAWTPAQHAQAMDRCHRIGQKRPVIVTFLTTPGTIDEHLQKILLEKQAVINTVMGERQAVLTESTVLRQVAERMLAARHERQPEGAAG